MVASKGERVHTQASAVSKFDLQIRLGIRSALS